MMKRRIAVPVAAVLAIAAAATVLVSSASGGPEAQVAKGGTYRVGWESSFGWTNSFDPTGEYLANAFAINTNLLLRGLIGYNHVGGPAGAVIVPDLATKVPKPTNGGKRYTFTIKNGVRFGPPLNRQITSSDVRYAVERLARPKNGAQYGFYYTVIKGFDAYADGKAKSISGIKTPNARTVIFDLTAPTGDFLMRLGMPAVFPMPQEVAKCFEGKPGAYGRYVIASGPYMIEGSEDLNISSCGVDEADLRLRRPDAAQPRPQPELQREDGQPQGTGEQPRSLRVHRQHQHRRHLQQDRQRGLRRLVRNGLAEGVPRVLREREQAEVPALELRGRDVLHHHEPHAAAVRRRSRPQGDELGPRPGGHAEGMGWPGVGRRGGAHHPELDAGQQAGRLPSVPDSRQPRERREGAC